MKIFYSVLIFSFFNVCAFSQTIDPYKFIATLQFDNRYHDYFSTKQEQVFPIAFTFNTHQDGNGNGSIDAEDACENTVKYAIGDSIYGTGRTELIKRGPNDQRPVVYFHFCKFSGYDVYEYWLYYPDNDYMNDHEHDWEKYFVYVKGNVPLYVRLSHHQKFNLFSWDELAKDEGHIILGVNGGSHAMEISHIILGVNGGSHAMEINIQNGVKIRYNGDISKKTGRLDFGDGTNSPWRVYSNDVNLIGVINYTQKPDCFFEGDPIYSGVPMLSSHKEYKKCNIAPWLRKEWNEPPIPRQKSKINMAITIGN